MIREYDMPDTTPIQPTNKTNPGMYPTKNKLTLDTDKLSSARAKLTLSKDKQASTKDKQTSNRAKLSFIKDKATLGKVNLPLANAKLSFITDGPMNGVQRSA